jgi:hypothetical protein
VRPDQLDRLTSLHDRLLEVALSDADPDNWIGHGKKPNELTRDERGDAKWCRGLAISSVALTMQVQRLMQNPIAGGAAVPDRPAAPTTPAEPEDMDAEIARFEQAASQVLARAADKTQR